MSIIQTLRKQGCRVRVDTIGTTEEDTLTYEAIIEQRSPKGGIFKCLDTVEFKDLSKLEDTIKEWYTEYKGLENRKGVSKFRFSMLEEPDYTWIDLIIQGEVTKQEFIDMYNEVVADKLFTLPEDIAKEMCERFGFSIDHPKFEINASMQGYTPIGSMEVKESDSICVEIDSDGELSESFVKKGV
ncbi:hypothetical protein COF68_04770 [Bacillus toyonensis]|uniref:hypothetical protein n=1 Tax=Bacillus toyonensis TaxID=155322 RepID=UPI000BFD66E9|nr:hypothetical protein [Bacillus toyonensis]PHE64164.1 hypothetical protein COF68_04770 [Bacillus toyonensis]